MMSAVLLIVSIILLLILLGLVLQSHRREARIHEVALSLGDQQRASAAQIATLQDRLDTNERLAAEWSRQFHASLSKAREDLRGEVARFSSTQEQNAERGRHDLLHRLSQLDQELARLVESASLAQREIVNRFETLERRLIAKAEEVGQRAEITALRVALEAASASQQAHLERLGAAVQDQQASIAAVREALAGQQAQMERLNAAVPALDQRAEIAAMQQSLAAQQAQSEQRLRAAIQALDQHQEIEQVKHQLLEVQRTLDQLPASPSPDEASLRFVTDDKAEAEVLAIAKSLAFIRPLVPYPKWRWDADWANPDLAFQMRRKVWAYFNERKLETPLVTDWYHGLQLCLYLGNDLSRQMFVAGCIEPNEFALLDKLLAPGMTFLDAGANDGIYTLFAARRVGNSGTIWAFEPSRREVERLAHNLKLNKLRGVHACPFALADFDGNAELRIAGYEHEGQNTLGAFVYDVVQELGKEPVTVRKLDSIIEENKIAALDVIKLDVEGAEYRALQGMREALRKFRPIILFEVSDAGLRNQGSNREELLEFLASREYSIYMFDYFTGLPIPAVPGLFSDNMLAVPAEKRLPASVGLSVPRTLS